MSAARNTKPVLVKCYARSRLYDTSAQRYVTVEQFRSSMANGVIFSVHPALMACYVVTGLGFGVVFGTASYARVTSALRPAVSACGG